MTHENDERLRWLTRLLAESDLPLDDPARRLVEALVPDEHYSHEQAELGLPLYVADELLGRSVAHLYPELHRHLLHCAHCAELHVALLADLAEEPQAVTVPTLVALRWPATGEPLQQFVARLAAELLRRLVVTVSDFSELIKTFFELVDELGERVTWGPTTANAFELAGEETAAAAVYLVATWQATLAVRDGVVARLGIAAQKSDFERLLRESARDAARRNGIKGEVAQRFTSAFVELALTSNAGVGGAKDGGPVLPG